MTRSGTARQDSPFTAAERAVWIDLMNLVLRLPAALEDVLRAAGDLSLVEYVVLAYLADSPDGSRRMSTIARQSHLSPSRTTHLVARLERRGLIERRPGEGDGRAVAAVLTPLGLDSVGKVTPVYEAAARHRVFDRLTAEQAQQLSAIARVIEPGAVRAESGHQSRQCCAAEDPLSSDRF